MVDLGRTRSHLLVLYVLCIIISTMVLTLFVVAFLSVRQVQQELRRESEFFKESLNQLLEDIEVLNRNGYQYVENPAKVNGYRNGEIRDAVVIDTKLKFDAALLANFCISIQSQCPDASTVSPGSIQLHNVKVTESSVDNSPEKVRSISTTEASSETDLLKEHEGSIRPVPIFMRRHSFIPNRKSNLIIKKIGKPVLIRRTGNTWGSWMVDSYPSLETKDKYYLTENYTGSILYEYDSQFRDDRTTKYSKQYTIPGSYYGTGNAIYRGSFYYHQAGGDTIVKFELDVSRASAIVNIQQSSYEGPMNLFKTDYNFYKFTVDENGLWLIYSYKPSSVEPTLSNMIVVAKLEPHYLEIEKTWNITVVRNRYSNAFIAQGLLYLLESGTATDTYVTCVYDLYKNEQFLTSIPFKNVFQNNVMLTYNFAGQPGNGELLAWDQGRVISYAILQRRR